MSVLDRAWDRLIDGDLRLWGRGAPDLVAATMARLERQRARRRLTERWRRGLVAALVLLGVFVVWAIAGKGRIEPQSRPASAPGRELPDASIPDPQPADALPTPLRPQDPRPRHEPVRVSDREGLLRLPVETSAIHWEGAEGDLDVLGRFVDLEFLHVEVREGAEAPTPGDAGWKLAALSKLQHLCLEGLPPASPGDLAPLAAIPNLQRLELRGGGWHGALSTLPHMEALVELTVAPARTPGGAALDAADLEHIGACAGLRALQLGPIPALDPARIRALAASLPLLRSLSLRDVAVDEEMVAAIAALDELHSLELWAAHAIDAEWLDPIWRRHSWRRLSLGYGGGVSEQALEHLAQMRELTSLSLGGATTLLHHWVPPAAFWSVIAELPRLTAIDFHRAYHITVDHLEPLHGKGIEAIVLQMPYVKNEVERERERLVAGLKTRFPALQRAQFVPPPEMGGRPTAVPGLTAQPGKRE